MRKFHAALAATALTAGALAGAGTAASPAAAGTTMWGWAVFEVDGARIRSCASTDCSVLGLGYRSHQAGWYCYQTANGFAHIYDHTTGVDGWAHSSVVDYSCS